MKWLDQHTTITSIEVLANGRRAQLTSSPTRQTLGHYDLLWR